MIADANAPSEFINELLSPKYKIDIVSKRFQERYRTIFKCNECSTGYFVMKQGKFGQFYSCTSGEVCCSSPRICEKCGRPMKLREGKFGQFWDAQDMESKAINVRILVSILCNILFWRILWIYLNQKQLIELIKKYDSDKEIYSSSSYNESQLRTDSFRPFLWFTDGI